MPAYAGNWKGENVRGGACAGVISQESMAGQRDAVNSKPMIADREQDKATF